MFFMNATDVRKEWSSVTDKVIRERPQFIRRTRDEMVLLSLRQLESILDAFKFTAKKILEADGTVTLSLNEIDIVENGADELKAKQALAKSILEYSQDFYNDFPLYSIAPNRKGHIPYVLKALILDDAEKIEKLNMPRWSELKRFCDRDGRECYKDADYCYYRKIDEHGNLKWTKNIERQRRNSERIVARDSKETASSDARVF